ncbi:MysB family protein [Escherichia coli]|nr:MysB family protein [Escherichia coli]
MPNDSMFYATLEEAIDAAREEFLADNPGIDAEDAPMCNSSMPKNTFCRTATSCGKLSFFADEGEEGECLPMFSGEAAQSVFDGDYDEIEIRQEWQEENTLHEWDEGEFQLEPPPDTECSRTDAAADEWDERVPINYSRAMTECRSAAVKYQKPERMADQGS